MAEKIKNKKERKKSNFECLYLRGHKMLLEFLPFHIVWTRAKMKKGDLSQNEKKRKQSYKGWELGASQGKSLKAKIEGFISPCPPVFSFF